MRTQVLVAFIIAPLTKRHDYRLKGLTLMEAQDRESSIFLGPGSLENWTSESAPSISYLSQ